MGISEQDAIKELQTRDAVFVAYSQATKLPYVICDEESFNDQVWAVSYTHLDVYKRQNLHRGLPHGICQRTQGS